VVQNEADVMAGNRKQNEASPATLVVAKLANAKGK
jgi:hypothetical protein